MIKTGQPNLRKDLVWSSVLISRGQVWSAGRGLVLKARSKNQICPRLEVTLAKRENIFMELTGPTVLGRSDFL